MATELGNLYKAINVLGAEYIKILERLLLEKDKVATRTLVDTLDYKTLKATNEIDLQILAASYLKYVDKGRYPYEKGINKNGKMPPVKPIIEWAKVKGITPDNRKGYKTMEQVGWAIARKIGREGIKPTNVIEDSKRILLNDIKLMNQIINGAGLDVSEVVNGLFKEFKQVKSEKLPTT